MKKRDYRVAYVRCPENHDHFILADPSVPVWAKTPPRSPISVECRGCGEHHWVYVFEPWKVGYISLEERAQGVAYVEPDRQS